MFRILLIFIALGASSTTSAQIKEAYFKFNIDVAAADNSEQSMISAKMLRDSKMIIHFDADHSRVDFILGQVSQTTTIINKTLNEGISYSTGSSGNIATKGTVDEFSPSNTAKSAMRSTVQPHDEYKKILGFKCRKYTVNDGQFVATYWCTDEINIDKALNTTFNSDLPGFPLAFSTVSNGLAMEYQATDYSFSIDNKVNLFSTDVPQGYTLMKTR